MIRNCQLTRITLQYCFNVQLKTDVNLALKVILLGAYTDLHNQPLLQHVNVYYAKDKLLGFRIVKQNKRTESFKYIIEF